MDPLEHIFVDGQFSVAAPLSPAVKMGNLLFISDIPAHVESGKIAVGDFPAQMKQTHAGECGCKLGPRGEGQCAADTQSREARPLV